MTMKMSTEERVEKWMKKEGIYGREAQWVWEMYDDGNSLGEIKRRYYRAIEQD